MELPRCRRLCFLEGSVSTGTEGTFKIKSESGAYRSAVGKIRGEQAKIWAVKGNRKRKQVLWRTHSDPYREIVYGWGS